MISNVCGQALAFNIKVASLWSGGHGFELRKTGQR